MSCPRKGSERGEKQREAEEGWKEIHDGNFFFRGFCGENTVTQWHAKEGSALFKEARDISKFSLPLPSGDPRTLLLLISLARSWHADAARLSTRRITRNTFANHVWRAWSGLACLFVIFRFCVLYKEFSRNVAVLIERRLPRTEW